MKTTAEGFGDTVNIKIPLDKGQFWEKVYNKNDLIGDVINDFKRENQMEFPQDYFMDWNCRDKPLNMTDPIKSLISYVTPTVNFNLKLKKIPMQIEDRMVTPDLVGKPFKDPFEVYVFKKSDKSMNIQTYPPSDVSSTGLDDYDPSAAHCNGENHLYISGGENPDGEINDKLWDIDLENQAISNPVKIPPKKNHSMLFIPPKYVFVAGGNDRKTFYYNTETREVNEWAPLNKPRTEPALVRVRNILYCLDNIKKNNTDQLTLEKTDLNSLEPHWELVNPEIDSSLPEGKLPQKFFGISTDLDDRIILLGGNMDETDQNGRNYLYDQENNLITPSSVPFKEFNLKEKTLLPYSRNIDYVLTDFTRQQPEVAFYVKNRNKTDLINFKPISEKYRALNPKIFDSRFDFNMPKVVIPEPPKEPETVVNPFIPTETEPIKDIPQIETPVVQVIPQDTKQKFQEPDVVVSVIKPEYVPPKIETKKPEIKVEVPTKVEPVPIQVSYNGVNIPKFHWNVNDPGNELNLENKGKIYTSYRPDAPPKVVDTEPNGINLYGSLCLPVIDTPNGEFNVKVPDINASQPNLKIETNKIKLQGPKVNIKPPEIKAPSANVNISGPKINTPNYKIDGSISPKIKVPSGSINFTGPNITTPNYNIRANSPKIEVPNASINLKSPKINKDYYVTGIIPGDPKLKVPSANIQVKAPSINYSQPNINLQGSGNLKVQSPNINIKGPQLKSPEYSLSGSIPGFKAPNADININSPKLKAPNANIQIKSPKIKAPDYNLSGNIPGYKVPNASLNVQTPNITPPSYKVSLQAPKKEKDFELCGIIPGKKPLNASLNVQAPQVTMPNYNVNVNSPRLKAPNYSVNVTAPKIKAPEYNLSGSIPGYKAPNANINIQAPKVNVPDYNVSVNAPKIKAPEYNLSGSIPGYKAPNANINIQAPKVNVPDYSVKVNAPKIKAPDYNLSGSIPGYKAPNANINIQAPKVSVPNYKVNVNGPNVKVPDYNLSGSIQGTKMPQANVNINGPNVKVPNYNLKVKAPEIKYDVPDAKVNLSGSVDEQFFQSGVIYGTKIPSGQIKINGPSYRSRSPNVNIRSPSINANSSGKKFHGTLDDPNFNLNSQVKGGKIGLNVGKPEINLKVDKSKLDYKSQKLIDDKYVRIENPQLGMSGNYNAISPSLRINPFDDIDANAKLNMPNLNIEGEGGDNNYNINLKPSKLEFDQPKIEIKEPKASIRLVSPEVNIEKPKIEYKGPTFETGKFNYDLKASGNSEHKLTNLRFKPVNVELGQSDNKVQFNTENNGIAELPKYNVSLELPKVEKENSGYVISNGNDNDEKLRGYNMNVNVSERNVNLQQTSSARAGRNLPMVGQKKTDFETSKIGVAGNLQSENINVDNLVSANVGIKGQKIGSRIIE